MTIAVLIGHALRGLLNSLAYDKVLSFDDDSCVLLPLPTPAEDLSSLGDGHCAFAGGGDVWKTFMRGAAAAAPGAVWLINATRGTAQELRIAWGPSAPAKLVLHGIYFSQRTRRLYGVNHGDEILGEAVEIFDVVVADADADHDHHAAPLRLVHLATVRSPLFGSMTLNDVVEGSTGEDASGGGGGGGGGAGIIEFYVSEWQPLGGFPVGGKHAPNVPLATKLRRAAHVPITALKVPLTRVFRCALPAIAGEGRASCSVASSTRFVGANGLAVSEDRGTVFVNDPPARTVHVMARGAATGELTELSKFETKHVCDNIEATADGKLSAGTIPLPYTYVV